MKISMDFEIVRGGLLCGRGRLFYRHDGYFWPKRENIIGSGISIDILKTDAIVHFMDADVHFKQKLNVELQRNCIVTSKKIQEPTLLLHTPLLWNGHPSPFPDTLTELLVKHYFFFNKVWKDSQTVGSFIDFRRTCLDVKRKYLRILLSPFVCSVMNVNRFLFLLVSENIFDLHQSKEEPEV